MSKYLVALAAILTVGCEPDPPKTQPSAKPSAGPSSTPRAPAHPKLPAKELRSVQCWVPISSALKRTLPVRQPEKPRRLKGLFSADGYEARVWEAAALGTGLCVVTTMRIYGEDMPTPPRVANLPNMKALPRRDNVLPPSGKGVNASELLVAVPITEWGKTLRSLGDKLDAEGKKACLAILDSKPDGDAMKAATTAFIDHYIQTGEPKTEPAPDASILAAIRTTCLSDAPDPAATAEAAKPAASAMP